MSEEEMEGKSVWVGPSQASWYVFTLAKIVYRIVTTVPYGKKLPIGNWLYNWSVKVLVFSRDMEVSDLDQE